jgi:alkyldihydroxyacetonephosphate synthase
LHIGFEVAIVPFGGGTSVVGGVEGIVETPKYIGVISVDMKHFNKLVEVDKKSLSARVEAGVFGPALLDLLAPHGLTLRHFPQSFEFSTVGGWVATRAGGHYATGRTHIDDFVSSVRMITPAGIVETRRLPASGAGPAPDRLFIGSEGSLGIITSVWLRVQEIVRYKFAATVFFESFEDGVAATQEIAQSNINPSNCRLIDPLESFGNGLAKGMLATLILGFESAHDFDYGPIMKQALVICERHHGKCPKGVSRAAPAASNRDNSADTWKDSFIKGSLCLLYLAMHTCLYLHSFVLPI